MNRNAGTEAEAGRGHCAVVYFHGMGEQKRYEELSRFVDQLDRYAFSEAQAGRGEAGKLRGIRARLEPSRVEDLGDQSYIRVLHLHKDENGALQRRRHHFHEVYWAPLAAGSTRSLSVLRWLGRRFLTPLATLRSPWRSRQRLRRAALLRLWSRNRTRMPRRALRHLLDYYDRFEGWEARNRHPGGSFGQFREYLREEHKDAQEALELEAMARRWRAFYLRQELGSAFVVLTLFQILLIGLLTAAQGLITLMVLASKQIPTWLQALQVISREQILAHPWPSSISLLLILVGIFRVARFLRSYLGDVQLWTTYEETDDKHRKRMEIMARSVAVLEHVLEDEDCRRVVVVAHSLGSAIAMDSLLRLGRHNRARHPAAPMKKPLHLEKLDLFITMGSPVDKIHYFFESHQGRYHRYNRVVEEVRGDLGSAPFAKNRKPWVHWLNFWDQGDLISGALDSPANRRSLDLRVDNIQLPSLRFPDPVASHEAYFSNREVMGRIYDGIFFDRHSFQDLPVTEDKGRDYAGAYLEPGSARPSARLAQVGMGSLPWLLSLHILLSYLGVSGWPGLISIALFLLMLALLGMGFLIAKIREPLSPIEKDARSFIPADAEEEDEAGVESDLQA